MHSVALHERMIHALAASGVHLSQPESRNLALLCVALALSPSCHLGTLALQLPRRLPQGPGQ